MSVGKANPICPQVLPDLQLIHPSIHLLTDWFINSQPMLDAGDECGSKSPAFAECAVQQGCGWVEQGGSSGMGSSSNLGRQGEFPGEMTY
jgi:hypothetical protein